MPNILTKTEINQRMVEWRNLKVLHTKAIAKVVRLQTIITDLKSQLLQKDIHIAELESALLDKETQRKSLSAKLWKAKKDRSAQVAEQTNKNKPGAQTGHEASRRPMPAPEDVTDRQIFDLAKCPACKYQVGDVVDTVEKYQEDIDLSPRNKIVRHYTITRHWCPNGFVEQSPKQTPIPPSLAE